MGNDPTTPDYASGALSSEPQTQMSPMGNDPTILRLKSNALPIELRTHHTIQTTEVDQSHMP